VRVRPKVEFTRKPIDPNVTFTLLRAMTLQAVPFQEWLERLASVRNTRKSVRHTRKAQSDQQR
jgi:hypothetical protein